MTFPLELTSLTKVFPTPSGPFVAVKNVNVDIETGEFVAILGHSGCGKSTVLSIIAGLDQATYGGVIIDGKAVNGPGPDRGMVFQAPCLLPWLTARQNVELAAAQRVPRRRRRETLAAAHAYLDMVGVGEAADQLPSQLSLGTQQCVSLARALAVEPRFLLLDEPFSQLDSLTRFDLQDTLLRVWDLSGKTVVMVTHDVDEALFLADRLILMTDGPEATIGDVLAVPFVRPRVRASVLGHAQYHACRRRVLDFLDHHAHQSRASVLDDVLEPSPDPVGANAPNGHETIVTPDGHTVDRSDGNVPYRVPGLVLWLKPDRRQTRDPLPRTQERRRQSETTGCTHTAASPRAT
jgi:nitrate ABC transporter ATP-binding subunit